MNAENIAENMKSMGYGANARTEISNPETGEVKNCNRVYLKSGSKNITAYLDLEGEAPALHVYSKHPDGHNGLTGKELIAHKNKCAAITREALRPAVIAAFVAEKYGADLGELADSFGLKNENDYLKPYTPNEPGGEPQETRKPRQSPPPLMG